MKPLIIIEPYDSESGIGIQMENLTGSDNGTGSHWNFTLIKSCIHCLDESVKDCKLVKYDSNIHVGCRFCKRSYSFRFGRDLILNYVDEQYLQKIIDFNYHQWTVGMIYKIDEEFGRK